MTSHALLAFAALFAAAPSTDARAQDVEWGPWHVVGPFGPIEDEPRLDAVFWPEKRMKDLQLDKEGPDLERRGSGRDKEEVGWIRLGDEAGEAPLDVGTLDMRKELRGVSKGIGWSSDAAVYLYRTANVTDATELVLFAGALDAGRVWLDGELLADLPSSWFQLRPFDGGLRLLLEPGRHHLLVKLVSDQRAELPFRMQAPREPDPAKLRDAVARAVRFLLGEQVADGAWIGWSEERRHTAMVVEALLAVGLEESHPAVAWGLENLEPSFGLGELWEHLIRALAASDSPRSASLQPMVKTLIDYQDRDGLWDDGNLEDSASCVAALAAARAAGWNVPDEVFERLEKGLARLPAKKVRGTPRGRPVPAGFGRAKGFDVDAQNTARVFACAAAARRALGDGLSASRAKKLDGLIESTLAWLETIGGWDRDPTAEHPYRGHLAHLFRIQSGMRALERDTFAGIDWRTIVTSFLLDHQQVDGSWSHYYAQQQIHDTAMALLLLAPHLGEGKTPPLRRLAKEGPLEGLALCASFDDPMRIWIALASDDAVPSLPDGTRLLRAALVARPVDATEETLEEWKLADAGIDALLECEAALGLKRRGAVDLSLRVSLAEDGEETEHELGPLRVVCTGAFDELLAARKEPPGSTPVRIFGRHFSVSSSTEEGDYSAFNLGDRSLRDVWLCAPGDEKPTIRIRPDARVWVRELVFVHGRPQVKAVGRPLAARVLVRVDDELALDFDLPADPCAVARCDLGKRVRFQELEITILESRDREVGRDGVGFAEIELFDRE